MRARDHDCGDTEFSFQQPRNKQDHQLLHIIDHNLISPFWRQQQSPRTKPNACLCSDGVPRGKGVVSQLDTVFEDLKIVHYLFQPARNCIRICLFEYIFHGVHRYRTTSHRYCKSQALEEGPGVRDWLLVRRRCTPLKTQSTPYRKVINDAGVFKVPSLRVDQYLSDTWHWSLSDMFSSCFHSIGESCLLFLPVAFEYR